MYGPTGAHGHSGPSSPYGAPSLSSLSGSGRRVRRRARRLASSRPPVAPSFAPLASTIAARANARRSQLDSYISTVRSNAIALRAAANTIRNNAAPELNGYLDDFRSYLAFVDSVVVAWDLEFGDWRDRDYHLITRPRKLGSESTSSILSNIGLARNVFDLIEDYADWFYPRVRSEINDIFRQLRSTSTALWGLNSALSGLFNDTLALYDNAGNLVTAANRWNSIGAVAASDEICRSYLNHSNYRRLRRPRNPGKHAAWNETCDRWENPDNGDYAYWSRSGDPRGFGPMPSRLKRGKRLVEPGCLPGEVCITAPLSGPSVPGFETLKDLSGSIDTTLNTMVVDNVFIEARRLLKEVQDLVNLLIGHLNFIMGVADGWAVPKFIEDAIDDRLEPMRSALQVVGESITVKRNVLSGAQSYWRSGDWRARVNPALTTVINTTNNLDNLRSSGISATCGYIYPSSSRSSSTLSRYWRRQGVPASCEESRGRPYISWEREKTPDLELGPVGGGGGSTPGIIGGRGPAPPEVASFGSVAPQDSGLKTWQKLTLVGGLVFLITRSK